MIIQKNLSRAVVLSLIYLVGCAPTLEVIKTDTLPVPKEFPDSIASGTSAALKSWRDFFRDKTLRHLIDLGLKNNQELHILEQEIHIADNEVMARQGEYLPKVGLAAEGGLEKVGEDTSQGRSDAANDVPEKLKKAKAGLVASWEVDIWGKLRNASKAAYYHYLSSIEGRRFAVTNLVSEIANTYFELQALDNQLSIVDNYVEILQKITKMVKLQKNAARVTALPVKRFESEVLKNEVRQVELRQKIIATQNKLNILVGRFPEKITRESKHFMTFEMPQVTAGIPSGLLEHRPDVKEASLELESAKLDLASAKARFYPSLTIDAGAGFETFNTAHFINPPGSVFYNVIGGITAPLLNRQAIKAAYFSANNKQIQAIYHYEQTLVKAFAEVVNQINMIKNLNEVYRLKSKQVAAMDQAAKISNILFQAARVDYIESLLTQRDALDAKIELVEVKQRQLSAYVNLYKAIGGGWKGNDGKEPGSTVLN
ncbi:MAG: TolC family protein [Bacteriovoracia bacterium]